MIDFTSYDSVRNNELVSKEFFKTISSYDLFQIMKEDSKNEDQVVDLQCVIDGILESNDTTKLIQLCSQSKLKDSWFDSEIFRTLYGKSDVVNEALFSNSRFDWYGVFIWNKDEMGNKILNDLLTSPESTKKAFYKNPRMDRSIIKSIIAGISEKDDFEAEIKKFSLQDRFTAIQFSLNIEEIPSKFYPGKDSPDSNELRFKDPYEGTLVFVRDLHKETTDVDFRRSLHHANYNLAESKFGIDTTYWIPEDESKLLDEKYPDYRIRYDEKYKLSFQKITEFLDQISSTTDYKKPGNYTSDDGEEREQSHSIYYSPATLTIMALSSLMNEYSLKNYRDELLTNLLQSKNWVIRAAGYSYLLNSVFTDSNADTLNRFTEFWDRFKNDKIALLHGIYNSTNIYLLFRTNLYLRDRLSNLTIDEHLTSEYRDYLISDLTYTFDVYHQMTFLPGDEYDIKIQGIYKSKLWSDEVKHAYEFLTKNQGVSRQSGSIIGKLFK